MTPQRGFTALRRREFQLLSQLNSYRRDMDLGLLKDASPEVLQHIQMIEEELEEIRWVLEQSERSPFSQWQLVLLVVFSFISLTTGMISIWYILH